MSKKNKEPLRIFSKEIFKEIELDGKLKFRYAISNFGQLISFTEKFEDGRIVRGSITEGYRIFRYRLRVNKDKISYKHKFFHRLVAEQFLPKTSPDQIYVLHLDHNLSNDFLNNLKWATKAEMLQHQNTNPKVLKAREDSKKQLLESQKKREREGKGLKLTSTQVMLIKKMLSKPDRTTRQKIIARQFGISEMQLYRIKSGKNWGNIKI